LHQITLEITLTMKPTLSPNTCALIAIFARIRPEPDTVRLLADTPWLLSAAKGLLLPGSYVLQLVAASDVELARRAIELSIKTAKRSKK
jgi:hypothetical protein